eukprot:gnl/MRDRNA2_/MRDRNA2_111205_c0_seq1.p1 gnl/MRDRNA2_/MRDRNA2_111205_c0~~gnl/MRDRNA2_/MRDRNA2_111205_c0_seq1.p1  ORF type:complete len:359 (-),score=52.78 gnl/MRDRNA2_/MRDRNA2_111205_c0_seq1:15-1091(-)
MGGAPSQIFSDLWLGGQDVLGDESFFAKNNIGYVLSLGPSAPNARIRLVAREHINIDDVPRADLSRHFSRVVRFIARSRHLGGASVYVHCAAGISRSTTCTCAYLMTHLDLTFKQALTFIVSRRKAACPNEGFQQQLKAFENSTERQSLAQELREMTPQYDEIRARDLDIVRSVLQGNHSQGSQARGSSQTSHGSTSPSQSPNMVSIERQAQQNAYRALQKAAAQQGRFVGQPKASALRIGTGGAEGDVGLAWLMEHYPRNSSASSSSTVAQRSSPGPGPPPVRRASSTGPSGRPAAGGGVQAVRGANTPSMAPKAGRERSTERYQRLMSIEPVLAQHKHSPAARPPAAKYAPAYGGR